MKIFVAGAAGFIGSNFLHWLLNAEPDVSVIHVDALTYAGNLANIKSLLDHPRHRFVRSDIRESAQLPSLMEGCHAVLNFAAESHVDNSIADPRAFMETNITGTFNLLESARALKKKPRFVQISTDEVYGSLGAGGKFTEKSSLAPNSPYSAAKASADLLVRAYHHTYKMDTVTTRCSNNYGPYQFPEKLIPVMIAQAQQDKPLPVYGDGLNVRDWIHVLDHARGVWLATIKGGAGEVYNFGADNEWTNLRLVQEILNILGKPESLISFVKDRPGHDRRYAVDASKAKRDLGWSPEVTFAEGLRQTIAWYGQNIQWLAQISNKEYRSFYEKWCDGKS